MSGLRAGAWTMALGVLLGAFGAHGLRSHLEPDRMDVYHTAVFYQLIHGLAMILTARSGVVMTGKPDWTLRLLISGVLLFSGSLYVYTLTGIRWLGAVTPFGGICFVLAWLRLGIFRRSGE
jgi:uncharacterized membrane protein YgdD (TMEM256/DUF423 family)